MIRGTFLIVGVASLACVAGCGSLKTLSRAQEMDYRIRQDRIRYCEQFSDMYFLLGHDYYQLAKRAEEQKDTARAQDAAQKAEIYLRMHRKLDQTVQEMRLDLEGRKEATRSKAENAKAAPPAPPKTESSPDRPSPSPQAGMPAAELRIPPP